MSGGAPAPASIAPRRASLRRGWWIAAPLAVALVIAGFFAYSQFGNAPAIHVPRQVLPTPNAYDNFQTAGAALIDESKVWFASRREYHPDRTTPEDRAYSSSEKGALLRANAAALAKVRAGLKYPCRTPRATSFAELFARAAPSKAGRLPALLLLDGQVKREKGDWSGAVDSFLDAAEFGAIVQNSGDLTLAFTAGIHARILALYDAWECVDHLDARRAVHAAARLHDIEARHVPFWQVLQNEEWERQACLLDTFRSPNWREDLGHVVYEMSDTSPDGVATMLLIDSQSAILGRYTDHADKVVDAARKPYAAHAAQPPLPSKMIDSILSLNDFSGQFGDALITTRYALLMAAFALHAYKLDHGSYPKALSDIVPDYLPSLPDDPFALSGPLRYRRTGSSYVLYSIGPDGKDDGGRPIKAPKVSSTRDRYRVVETSIGDIVAGVNK